VVVIRRSGNGVRAFNGTSEKEEDIVSEKSIGEAAVLNMEKSGEKMWRKIE
jgi:hypothetical protein